MLVISVTMTFYVSVVENIIEQLKETVVPRPLVMVGGFPSQAFPGLWQRIGADGTAADAQAAVDLGNRWMATRAELEPSGVW